jgi:hypothetical protein
MTEVMSIPRDVDDRLEKLLKQAFAEGLAEPTSEGDQATGEPVPADLRRSLLERARTLTGELLALELLEAGDPLGWGFDELVAEAADYEREARELLLGHGDPLDFPPEVLARLFWRVELDPADWDELLAQFVVTSVTFGSAAEGFARGRTSGLAESERGKMLDPSASQRDPYRAGRVAAAFVEEVIDEWTVLSRGTSPEDPQD